MSNKCTLKQLLLSLFFCFFFFFFSNFLTFLFSFSRQVFFNSYNHFADILFLSNFFRTFHSLYPFYVSFYIFLYSHLMSFSFYASVFIPFYLLFKCCLILFTPPPPTLKLYYNFAGKFLSKLVSKQLVM